VGFQNLLAIPSLRASVLESEFMEDDNRMGRKVKMGKIIKIIIA
jgi:hypothetical protein